MGSNMGFATTSDGNIDFNSARLDTELADLFDKVDQDVSSTATPTFDGIIISAIDTTDNSSPPTDGELDAAFGAPADLGDGYICIYDKNDANTDVFLCITRDATWQYVQLTTAV